MCVQQVDLGPEGRIGELHVRNRTFTSDLIAHTDYTRILQCTASRRHSIG